MSSRLLSRAHCSFILTGKGKIIARSSKRAANGIVLFQWEPSPLHMERKSCGALLTPSGPASAQCQCWLALNVVFQNIRVWENHQPSWKLPPHNFLYCILGQRAWDQDRQPSPFFSTSRMWDKATLHYTIQCSYLQIKNHTATIVFV